MQVAQPFCGDGICNEQPPSSCIQDCYDVITSLCPPLAAPTGHIPVFWVEEDTLGDIISNQVFICNIFHVKILTDLYFQSSFIDYLDWSEFSMEWILSMMTMLLPPFRISAIAVIPCRILFKMCTVERCTICQIQYV